MGELDELYEVIKSLEQENKDKSKELADTKVELAKAQHWCDTHKDNHESTKEEATALEKENKELKDQIDKINRDLQSAEHHRDTHENNHKSAEKENKIIQDDLAASRLEIGKVTAAFEEQSKLKDHLQASLSKLQDDLKTNSAELDELYKVIKSLEQESKDKSKELADTKLELAKAQHWCDTHKDNHESTKEEATALEKENKELK